MRTLLLSIITTILLFSCAEKQADNVHTYWINSAKVDCTGASPMSCLQFQKSDTLSYGADWQFLYSSIKGFDYVPGYIYKLKVKETKLDATKVPADASSISYDLVEVISKEADPRLAIHDIYALTSISGKDLDFSSEELAAIRPDLEINVTKMMISGTDGCNRYNGPITLLDDENIKFGQIASTRKACKNMDYADKVTAAFNLVTRYSKKNNHLSLTLDDGTELLRFIKVD